MLAAFFLHEKLGIVGKVGCALCLIGSVVIVLHAPEEKEINSVDEILNYALQPGKQPFFLPHLRFARSTVQQQIPGSRYGISLLSAHTRKKKREMSVPRMIQKQELRTQLQHQQGRLAISGAGTERRLVFCGGVVFTLLF